MVTLLPCLRKREDSFPVCKFRAVGMHDESNLIIGRRDWSFAFTPLLYRWCPVGAGVTIPCNQWVLVPPSPENGQDSMTEHFLKNCGPVFSPRPVSGDAGGLAWGGLPTLPSVLFSKVRPYRRATYRMGKETMASQDDLARTKCCAVHKKDHAMRRASSLPYLRHSDCGSFRSIRICSRSSLAGRQA